MQDAPTLPDAQPDAQPDTQPGETQQPKPDADAPRFTQADVDRFCGNVRAEERRKFEAMQRQPEPKPAKPSKANGSDAPSMAELQSQIEDLTLGRQFDAAVSGIALTDAQRSAMEVLFRSQRPEDPRSWATSTVDSLGFATANTSQPAPVADTPPTPTAPPVTDKGAPSPQRNLDRVLNPNEWSADDIARIQAEKGASEGNRYIRERVEQWYRGVRVRPPVRR